MSKKEEKIPEEHDKGLKDYFKKLRREIKEQTKKEIERQKKEKYDPMV